MTVVEIPMTRIGPGARSMGRESGCGSCGLRVRGVADPRHGVTSLVDLGLPVMTSDLDLVLRSTFPPIFGPLTSEKP